MKKGYVILSSFHNEFLCKEDYSSKFKVIKNWFDCIVFNSKKEAEYELKFLSVTYPDIFSSSLITIIPIYYTK